MRSTNWTAVVAMCSLAALAACGGGDTAEDEMAPDTMMTDTPAEEPAMEPMGGAAMLPEGVTQEMVAQGEQIFTSTGNCMTCHGPDASGTTLAPNLRDSEWINVAEGSYEEIMGVVQNGVAQPQQYPAPMPAMGGAQLSEDQIRAVAAYVYSISHGG